MQTKVSNNSKKYIYRKNALGTDDGCCKKLYKTKK